MAQDPDLQDESPEEPPSWRDRFVAQLDQIKFYVYCTLLLLLLLVGALWKRILITVPAGHHAVLFARFHGGTLTQPIYGEGVHVIWPWNSLIPYETRLQSRAIKFEVLSQEGLSLKIGLAIRYTLSVPSLGYLHRDIGPDYFERLIKPEIAGHLRHTFGGRPANEIYSSARVVLQEIGHVPILGRAGWNLPADGRSAAEPYLRLEEIRLVDVELPPTLMAAITEKQRQEQLTLEYRHRLEREEKEAERKRTEASGIRDFSLIAGKISPEALRWRGIDAALELAKSNNSKVIILGNSPSGGPIMLNVGDQAQSPTAELDHAAPRRPRSEEKEPEKK